MLEEALLEMVREESSRGVECSAAEEYGTSNKGFGTGSGTEEISALGRVSSTLGEERFLPCSVEPGFLPFSEVTECDG